MSPAPPGGPTAHLVWVIEAQEGVYIGAWERFVCGAHLVWVIEARPHALMGPDHHLRGIARVGWEGSDGPYNVWVGSRLGCV